ncbi:zinc finger autosomal protein-like [Oppia nitens]|uniref:zinc finger autosomal protein-like n=1 Tax=Oppia nitens TaxID=1686743 RepID=UPI0023DAF4FC|nr:zinc finger autosomal protein-like [Oppia nitens]
MHTTFHKDINKTKVYCNVCAMTFYTKEQLDQHKDEQHPPDVKHCILYGCSLCKENQFETVDDLDQHLETHIEKIDYLKSMKYRCAVCKTFTAITDESVLSHMRQKHRHYKCAFDCSLIAQDFPSLERHAKSVHKRFVSYFECKFCDYGSAAFGSLMQHNLSSHAIDWVSQQYKCCLCDSSFDYLDTESLLHHLVRHAPDFSYFECKICNKREKQLKAIERHIKSHNGVTDEEFFHNICNLNDLFSELLKVKESDEQRKRMNAAADPQNAIKGLLDEEFGHNYDNNIDDQLSSLVNDTILNGFEVEENHENPILSIPENGIPSIPDGVDNEVEGIDPNDGFAYISQGSDGLWRAAD